ncbi:Dna-directed Rna polymerase I RPA43 [Cardiosporidium cionae]|uniref:Dna-directed Rna polymerase I RPA43 n=1 Tax=Cardiosporidium cionae TaxID=476202 RepID=A0ABQ7JC67_9APIC|nr:Dna-directed Rna polymerase I RPA43 [Cardiosporidium cionae]|eukprot:KAF8821538.1 Dna-directed Rna polymerase I RPA43 [Cardiosporidium cionae]
MAQIPWETLSAGLLSLNDAVFILQNCTADLSRNLGPAECQSISLQLRQIIESLNETHFGEHFYKILAKGTVQLLPCYLNRVSAGIRSYLSNFLLRFVPEFNGIWLGYGKIDVLDSLGYTPESESWGIVVFDIIVECLVFRPSIGSFVVGKVNQVRPGHLGLLVHGFFSAIIHRNHIPTKFRYEKSVYQNSTDNTEVALHSIVRFEVIKYQSSASGEILSIEGSLHDTTNAGLIQEVFPPIKKQALH